MQHQPESDCPGIRLIQDRAVWDRLADSHPNRHLLQTWAWGELKSQHGWQAERLALLDGDEAVAGAQVLSRAIGRLFPIAYVPKGPMVDWTNAPQVTALLTAVRDFCRRQRCAFIKIEPPIRSDDRLLRHLTALGFRPSRWAVQPPRTILVDLALPEEHILAAMKQKTRYNIRLAHRKGVSVRQGTSADIGTFFNLMIRTGQRDSFSIHDRQYYSDAFLLYQPERCALLLAEVTGKPVAGLMVFAHPPVAYYLFGASSDDARELMPNYLLQWEAMRWARRHACNIYDLWGVPDQDEETMESRVGKLDATGQGLWGVYRFKRGFGGRVVRDVGAFDFVLNPPLFWAYNRLMSIRGRHGGV